LNRPILHVVVGTTRRLAAADPLLYLTEASRARPDGPRNTLILQD